MKKRYFWLILFLIFVTATAHRIKLARELDYFDESDGTGFYQVENALQYRYANMAAHGVPIPSHDARLQYPEGTDTFKSLTVFMEYVAGWTYRLFNPSVSFHVYAIWFVAAVSSLAAIPAGMAGALLWGSLPAGIVAALLYAFSLPAFYRNVGTFLLESFALPFLFAGTWLLAGAMEEESEGRRRLKALFAGLAMAVALASWHFSRFYIAELAVCFSAALFMMRKPGKEMRVSLALFIAPMAAASLAFPAIREAGGLWSPFLIIFATALVLTFFRFPAKVDLAAGVLVVAALSLVKYLAGAEGAYTHVYGTMLSIIGNFGVKPADPSLIPMESRLLWVGAFAPPAMDHIVTTLLFPAVLLVLAAPLIAANFRNGTWRGAHVMMMLLAALWTVEYLFMRRMGAVAIFFVSVIACGGSVYCLATAGRKKAVSTVLVIVSIGALLWNSWTYLGGNRLQRILSRYNAGKSDVEKNSVPVWNSYYLDVLGWIKADTLPTDPFVAQMSASGSILAYTGRPVVLHSKFETKSIRDKYEKYVSALYSDEETLYRFCRENGARYFLYEADFTLSRNSSSYRYIADRLNLRGDETSVLMHFFPEKLKHFKMVYQNAVYRVYKVDEGKTPPVNANRPYQPLYDPALYGVSFGRIQGLDESSPEVIRNFKNAMISFEKTMAVAQAGDPALALSLVRNLDKKWPNLLHLNAFMCELYFGVGDTENMLNACAEEVRTTGHDPVAHRRMAKAYSIAGLGDMEAEENEKAKTLEEIAGRFEWEL